MNRYADPPPDLRHYSDGHHDTDWMTNAACRGTDPEIFFPNHEHNRQNRYSIGYATRQAQQICLSCPVIADCLTYALETDTRFGIWAGTTETDRARLTGRKQPRR